MAGATSVEPAFIEGYMPFDEGTFSEKQGILLARKVCNAGLGVQAISAHIDLGDCAGLEKLLRRLDFAAAAGARIVITNATTTDREGILLKTIAAIQPQLGTRDMILALENPGHGANALLPDGARGSAFVASLADPHIRMNYDIGNAETYGSRVGSAADDLALALPVLAHLHLKDVQIVGNDWHFCALGQGDVGYGTTLALSKLPSGLPIGIEHPIRLWRPNRGNPQRRTEAPEEVTVIAAVRRAIAFVRAGLNFVESAG